MAIEEKKTRCMFCSLGCGLIVKTERGVPVDLEYDMEKPINEGSLCPRGNYMYELLSHRGRIQKPLVRIDGSLKDASLDEAYSVAASALNKIKEKYGGDSIGVIMNSECFNEDVLLGYKFATEVIGTNNFDIGLLQEDIDLLDSGEAHKQATLADVEQSDVILIIGDALTKSPVLSKRIMRAKYKKKETRIIVIDPKKSNTSWFATAHLRVAPTEEAPLLAEILKASLSLSRKKLSKSNEELKRKLKGIDCKLTGISEGEVKRVASELMEAKGGVIIFSTSFGKVGNDFALATFAKLIAGISGKKFLPLYTGGNSLGAYSVMNTLMSKRISSEELIEAAAKNKIHALLIFGEDFFRLLPTEETKKAIQNLDFLLVSDIFLTDSAKNGNVVIPQASCGEKEGTVVNCEGKTEKVLPVCNPLGTSQSEFAIINELSRRLTGKELASLKEASDEVKKIFERRKANTFDIATVIEELKAMKTKKDPEHPFILLLDDDIVHYRSGSLSSHFFWARANCGKPYVEISKADSKALKISTGTMVSLKSKFGKSVFIARVTERVPQGILSVPHHFAGVRSLLPWAIDPRSKRIRYGCGMVGVVKE